MADYCWHSAFACHADLESTRLCTKSPCSGISLCNLSVLCVSVVWFYSEFINHRDTEDTEVAQRKQYEETFCARLIHSKISTAWRNITASGFDNQFALRLLS